MGGPRAYSIFHPNYGFVPVAATPVLDRHGGDNGEVTVATGRLRRFFFGWGTAGGALAVRHRLQTATGSRFWFSNSARLISN